MEWCTMVYNYNAPNGAQMPQFSYPMVSAQMPLRRYIRIHR